MRKLKNTGRQKMKTNLVTIEDLEDYAFYESGLSADGCLDRLDDYAKEAIKRYGRILLTKQKDRYIAGFQGCCYACEPVGMLNQELEKKLQQCKQTN
jgi:hypothetical protein